MSLSKKQHLDSGYGHGDSYIGAGYHNSEGVGHTHDEIPSSSSGYGYGYGEGSGGIIDCGHGDLFNAAGYDNDSTSIFCGHG